MWVWKDIFSLFSRRCKLWAFIVGCQCWFRTLFRVLCILWGLAVVLYDFYDFYGFDVLCSIMFCQASVLLDETTFELFASLLWD